MKGVETDASAMAVNAGQTMSRGDIMIKAVASIEWRLQYRSNAEFQQTRMDQECGL